MWRNWSVLPNTIKINLKYHGLPHTAQHRVQWITTRGFPHLMKLLLRPKLLRSKRSASRRGPSDLQLQMILNGLSEPHYERLQHLDIVVIMNLAECHSLRLNRYQHI